MNSEKIIEVIIAIFLPPAVYEMVPLPHYGLTWYYVSLFGSLLSYMPYTLF